MAGRVRARQERMKEEPCPESLPVFTLRLTWARGERDPCKVRTGLAHSCPFQALISTLVFLNNFVIS